MPTNTVRQTSFAHYRDLIVHKAFADFRAEAERTYLGVIWWVLEPLINMGIYYLVFGLFLGHNREGFIPYLLTGLVAWRFLDVAVTRASISIMSNMAMVRQIPFRKIIFPLIAMATCAMEFLFSLLLLLVVLLFFGHFPNVYWLAFPGVMAILVMLSLALALPLSAMVPFVPDLTKPVQYGLRITFYLSGIMYYVADLPARAQYYLAWNPALHVIEAFRDVFLLGRWPSPMPLLYVTAISCVGIVLGIWLHRRMDGVYAKRVTL
jgi:lipopolysaccharide transport system permease protein